MPELGVGPEDPASAADEGRLLSEPPSFPCATSDAFPETREGPVYGNEDEDGTGL